MNSSLHIPMEAVLRQMDLWYRTELGACLLEAEHAAVTHHLQDCFGAHLLQLGGPNEAFLFKQNPAFHAVRLSPEATPVFRGPSVCGSFEELPFFPDSMDVVLLPHVLEFAVNPQQILAQTQQVLAPEGRVMILGFNPWSLWGLYRYFHHKTLPWQGCFYSALRVKEWLKKQGFVIEEVGSFFFRPPLSRAKSLQHWMVLEALGRLLWADSGAVYLVIARKRVAALVPVDESLRYVGTT